MTLTENGKWKVENVFIEHFPLSIFRFPFN